MASTSGSQGEELIDKDVNRTVDIAGRFGGKNVRDFLATYRNKIEQRDIQDLEKISSFKWVVKPGIRERVIEIQNEHATWTEFEKALLA